RPRREDPHRLFVRPLLRLGPAAAQVIEHPLVRRRAHRDGADVRYEVRVILRHLRTELEEPVQRVVGPGDVTIQARRRVVDRLCAHCVRWCRCQCGGERSVAVLPDLLSAAIASLWRSATSTHDWSARFVLTASASTWM